MTCIKDVPYVDRWTGRVTDLQEETTQLGRIVFDLFDKEVPRTTTNFKELCTRIHGYGYEGSRIHRIIPGCIVQGGDILDRDGIRGCSVYGGSFAGT